MTTEKEVAADLILRDLYYNTAIGYQSKERLYQDARAAGLSVSRRKVQSGWHIKALLQNLQRLQKLLGDKLTSLVLECKCKRTL